MGRDCGTLASAVGGEGGSRVVLRRRRMLSKGLGGERPRFACQ